MSNVSRHVSTGVCILETLALLFVISIGSIALALALPIAFWHEQQATLQATTVNIPRYVMYIPISSKYQMRLIPSTVPRTLNPERRYYA